MDLNEILTKERDSLRDENIELRKRIHQLEISLQKALDMLENNVEGTLKGQIPTTMRRSFYSEYGDLPVLMLIFFSLLIKGFNIVIKYHE